MKRFPFTDDSGTYDALMLDPQVLPLANKDYAYTGGVCPCRGYYIATLCPCLNCDDTPEFPFVGEPAMYVEGGRVTISFAGRTLLPLIVMHMSRLNPVDSGLRTAETGIGSVAPWPEYVVRYGHIAYAIRHCIEEPPFSGTVTATLRRNGDQIGIYGPYECLTGLPLCLGETLPDSSYTAIPVNYWLTSTGCHNFDLLVEFEGSNGENESYVCRSSVLVIGDSYGGASSEVGSVGVYGDQYAEEDCSVLGTNTDFDKDVALRIVRLKGPFATQQDASDVLDYWHDFIKAYGKTCVCRSSCSIRALLADYVVRDDVGLKLQYSGENAGLGAEVDTCEDGEVFYYVTFDPPDGASIYGLVTFKDGSTTVVGASPSGAVIPPCSGVKFYIEGVQDDWTSETSVINGEHRPQRLESQLPCCIEDPESDFYQLAWDFFYDPVTELYFGVPNNSSDWNKFKASGQYEPFGDKSRGKISAIKKLIDELPGAFR